MAKEIDNSMLRRMVIMQDIGGVIEEVTRLRAEVERLKGPFTCKHDPRHAGGACAACHAQALTDLEVANLQVSELRGVIEAMCEYYGHDTDDSNKCKPGCYACKWAIRR